MTIKKKLAGILAAVMLINSASVLGNVQDRLPPDGISPIVVGHTANSSTGDIFPHAQITFKHAVNTTDDTEINNINYQTEATFYSFILNDINGNKLLSNRFDAKKVGGKYQETYIENIEDYISNANDFKNGTLYKVEVQPGHFHYDAEGKPYDAPLSSVSKNPYKFFLTDFNTIMRERNDQIEVLWEYIPGATYQLVYIDRDVNTKDGVDGKDGSEQTGVGSQTVTLTESDVQLVIEGGVKKAKYVIPNTLPGQKYSAYVLVKGIANSFLTDKWDNVGKNTETPKIAQASRSVGLSIYNIGRNRIELIWELGAWADNNTLKTTKIYRRTQGEASYTLVGTINNASLNPRDPGRFEHDEPITKSDYYVEFVFTGANGEESLFTKEVTYTPYELREQPLKPQVPNPYSDSLKNKEGFDKKDYLVTNDDVSIDKMKPNTFHVSSKSPLEVQLVWDAPQKADGSIEHEMAYDIWVVEEESMLEDELLEPIISDLSIAEYDADEVIYKQDQKTIVGFRTILDQYVTNKGALKSLISNQTYYIKIVAKRDYSGEYSISQPTVIAITIDKNGDIFTPPVLAKPPLRIQENGVEKESITIEWLEKWYEIKANDANAYEDEEEKFFARLWNSKVYTGGTPAIKFKVEEGLELTEHILKTKKDVEAVKQLVGSSYSTHYRDREVSLGTDVKYEVKTLLYDEVIKQIKEENASYGTPSAITLEKWIVQNESDTTEGWGIIAPGNVNHGDSLPWKEHKVEGLKSNTRYIILIRAYRELDNGDKLTQTFPSYVIGTTQSDYEGPEAIPTVPVLNPNGTTDESVSVWWTYNEDFEYEMVYSRLDDPDKGISWPVELSSTPGNENYVSNGARAIVTITGLAPETSYNVWIRAKQKEGEEVSNWSNPVTQKTLSIEDPDAPRGLGPAAYQSILELGLDFRPISSDYITVEWLKDVEDIEAELGPNKVYSYVVEFADNPEFLDSISFDTTKGAEGSGVEILDKTIVRFTGLEANWPYYVRVKTVLTYTNPETGKQIIKESVFTKYVRIMTKTSDDEYDGGDNENVVIYPEAVVETYKDGVWTYEIVDAAKIMTQIQTNKNYYYTITMENYKNKYDAKVRTIKMPKKVWDTISNQNMALKIVTNIGVYEIPGKALGSYANVHQATDVVQFDLTRMEYLDIYSYIRSYPEEYRSGERLAIAIKGSSKQTVVQKLDELMKVKLELEITQSYNYTNFSTYQYNYNSGNWVKYTPAVDVVDNSYLYYGTAYMGLNALYERSVASSNSSATYAMNQLISRYDIKGLGTTYSKYTNVGVSQYVTLMLGVSQNRSGMNLASGATTDDYAKAKIAGLYTSSNRDAVTREQALAGIIKLYELKNGYQVKPSSLSFANVSSNYKQAFSKAYAIGLIESTFTNPQGSITYGELCDWLIQVIE